MRNRLAQIVTLLWLLTLPLSARAEVAQPTPMPNTFVHDFAGVISEDKRAEIQLKARRLKDEYQTEIAVVTIDSLQGEDSFDYSMRMARSWGIGSKDNDIRGLLILVAIKDRKTAFRTSRHIEGELPDSVTGEIGRQMNAYFKQGDFGGGLSLGMDKISARLEASYQPRPVASQAANADAGLGWLWLPVTGLSTLGLGYAVLRHRRKKRGDAAQTRRATPGGFRAWAASVDPSPVPKVKRKTSSHSKPTPHRSTNKSSSPAPSSRPTRNDDSGSSGYDSSSSSYDSGSSSSSDSGSSYSGGSDFGGGGSDSSW